MNACRASARRPRRTATQAVLAAAVSTASGWPANALAAADDDRLLGFSQGRVFQTAVHEPQLVAELQVPGGEPFLLFSGLGCADCDINRSLYIERPANGPQRSGETGRRYAYPGEYRDPQTQSLVQAVRTFVGHCTPTLHEGVLWVTRSRAESGVWQQSRYLAQVEGAKLVEYPRPEPAVTLQAALKAVARGDCAELPGRKFTTEP